MQKGIADVTLQQKNTKTGKTKGFPENICTVYQFIR